MVNNRVRKVANLKQFNKKINKIAAGIELEANTVKKKVAIAIDQVVTLATPVDTGRARANWRVGIDAPVQGTTEDTDKNGQATLQAAKDKINSTDSGEDIFISNSLPYIGKLNDGSSAQAPAGFVEKAIQKGINAVANARIIK